MKAVLPAATFAIAIALTAIAGTCGREAHGGYPDDTRSSALYAVSYCDAAVAGMRDHYARVRPELERLLATDRAAARIFLEQHVASIVSNPRSGCDSARVLVQQELEAGGDDMRIREDGGRLGFYEPRIHDAEQAYLALHGALERQQSIELRPLTDALARALR